MTKDFTQGNINKQLLAFMAPMLIGSLVQQLTGIVDSVIVGRIVGGNYLAAIGISFAAFHLIVSILIGFMTGSSVVASQFFGAKQNKDVKITVSTSIVFIGITTLISSVLGIIFAPIILRVLGTGTDVFDQAVIFMRVLLGGTIGLIYYHVYATFLRALGDSKTPLYVLIVSSILNIGLNAVLFLSFDIGMWVIAFTLVFSQSIASIIIYFYIKKKVPALHIERLTFSKEHFRLIFKNGWPAAIQMSYFSFAILAVTRLINGFGSSAMAGITLAGRIDQIATMPIAMISIAMSTFVAQNMGANQEKRAQEGLKIATIQSIILAVLISIIIFLTGRYLFALFVHPSDANFTEIIHTGLSYMNIIVSFYVVAAILFAFNGFFRGVGDAMMAMLFPIVSLTIRTIVSYLLVHLGGFGPEALAWAIPIGWIITTICSFIYYKKRLWVGKMKLL